MKNIEQYIAANRGRYEDELIEFCRLPSVSADPAFRPGVEAAAEWVAGQLRALKFETSIVRGAGCPIVYAESPPVPGKPVVLIYGHYDVQPPDPLDLWVTPPFEPTRRDGNLYARGATDDKGQVLTHIKAAEAWLAAEGRLPLQLKFLIEGEEETGSEAVYPFIRDNARKLACHAIVVSDGSQFGPGQPAITYGLRGIAYYELHATGPNRDLHSGSFGGSVTNPANAIAKLIAAMTDDQGRIQIPGFYDDVVPLTDRERSQFAALPFDEKHSCEQIGVDGVTGEAGYTTLERRWARPTCDVNGLWSGYQKAGAKTVLPSKAGVKFSFRLVPNQQPDKITEGVRKFVEQFKIPGIRWELKPSHGCPGMLVSLESPFVEAAARSLEAAFGRPAVYTREGGSIPVVATLAEALGADTLLLGWGQEDDGAHSPNEKFSLDDFHRGIAASARLWAEITR